MVSGGYSGGKSWGFAGGRICDPVWQMGWRNPAGGWWSLATPLKRNAIQFGYHLVMTNSSPWFFDGP